jgi:REP element-mobilizing transposase RayT
LTEKAKVYLVNWTTVRRAKQLAGNVASIVVSFVKNSRELNQCSLGGFVVLPDEVHVIIAPIGDNTCDSVVRYIRRASERLINRELSRTGEVWDSNVSETHIKTDKMLIESLHKIEYLPCHKNLVKYPSDYQYIHLQHKDSIDDLTHLLEG